eukprot:CAMPEP_0185032306 /NCGR_PEP_ID=MMETSP1103-20130426/20268_1 /TAXON_ID=36769 /ORGANISM="Paraphysomonas bandaiensis, Strain Caron Lab Isolate" /LENGTH=890 /DNA_ID=CAMNT_0027568151 /DNA_START=276 /DNA_END=2948 /DNA_ORIENTATION=+
MTSNDKHGTLVGHIRAKGMHTNLLLTVKFTEDCRFGFAGVMKGSMEMLAIDVGKLQVWHKKALNCANSSVSSSGSKSSKPPLSGLKISSKRSSIVDSNGLRHNSKAAKLVRTYNHLDPKLRGFGAVTPLRRESDSNITKYVLVCGRGIKNVHVWLVTTSTSEDVSPTWVCLYDVPSNGVTIEALGFREVLVSDSADPSSALLHVADVPHCGPSDAECSNTTPVESNTPVVSPGGFVVPTRRLEMMSKSVGMCVRVWDLSNLEKDAESNKIPYEDIPNSADCRTFSENGFLAFGGTYDFSVMRIDAPKWANRECYEVPSRCLEDDNGQRRRRLMRQIQEVISCQDGHHALALCTDGGVLYYSSPLEYSTESYTTHIQTKKDDITVSTSGHTLTSSSNVNTPNALPRSISDSSVESSASTASSAPKRPAVRPGSLLEFSSLVREVEVGPEYMTDDAWCLKRVTKRGILVLIRACRGVATDDEDPGAIIDVSILSDLVPEEVTDSAIPSALIANGYKWHNYDVYHDPTPTMNWDKPPVSDVPKRSKAIVTTPRASKQNNSNSENVESIAKGKGYSTPTLAPIPNHEAKKVKGISPQEASAPSTRSSSGDLTSNTSRGRNRGLASDSKNPKPSLNAVSKRLYTSTESSSSTSTASCESSTIGTRTRVRKEEENTWEYLEGALQPFTATSALSSVSTCAGEKKMKKVHVRPITPCPTVKRVKPSTVVHAVKSVHPAIKEVQSLYNDWLKIFPVYKKNDTVATGYCELGFHASTFVEFALQQQHSLHYQFTSEFYRKVLDVVSAAVNSVEGEVDRNKLEETCECVLKDHLDKYEAIVGEMIHTQKVELRASAARDFLTTSTSTSASLNDWRFMHTDMFTHAHGVVRVTKEILQRHM